ncbi:MAG: hypothetical protein ABL967_05525 [Bryobacteraceae bacterium]
MRTTIEMKEKHRAKLLELAALRGEKGFSEIVSEALEQYLAPNREQEDVVRRALRTRGVLSKADAILLRKETLKLRESWR